MKFLNRTYYIILTILLLAAGFAGFIVGLLFYDINFEPGKAHKVEADSVVSVDATAIFSKNYNDAWSKINSHSDYNQLIEKVFCEVINADSIKPFAVKYGKPKIELEMLVGEAIAYPELNTIMLNSLEKYEHIELVRIFAQHLGYYYAYKAEGK